MPPTPAEKAYRATDAYKYARRLRAQRPDVKAYNKVRRAVKKHISGKG